MFRCRVVPLLSEGRNPDTARSPAVEVYSAPFHLTGPKATSDAELHPLREVPRWTWSGDVS
jgi:hypothetical protein